MHHGSGCDNYLMVTLDKHADADDWFREHGLPIK